MNILEKIYQDKKIEVRNCKKERSLLKICQILKNNKRTPKNFTKAILDKIKSQEIALIAEVKKASPSKGIIRENFNPVEIANIYQDNGACCISVLTDEKYFMGHASYLEDIRRNTNLPLLRKDFIIDPYQIYEAKMIGADCILLIMAMLEEDQALEFEKIANDIGLDVLVETHNEKEIKSALKLKTKLIGINNRNLKTLKVDINTSKELRKLIPEDKIVICESGISSNAQIKEMQKYQINSFLIGESLTKEENIKLALNNLLGK